MNLVELTHTVCRVQLSAEPTLYSFTYTKPRSFQAIDLRPVKDSGFSLRYCTELPSPAQPWCLVLWVSKYIGDTSLSVVNEQLLANEVFGSLRFTQFAGLSSLV